MFKSVKRLFSKEGLAGFERVRERAKELAGRLAKGEDKRDDTEILEILGDYGAEVAPFRVVSSKRELKEAIENIGCPVMVKPITTKVIARSQAGAVILVESADEAQRAYAQVIGRVVSSTPWIGVTGIIAQGRVDGDGKLSLSWQRKKRKSFPFTCVKRLFKGDERGQEKQVELSSKEELLAHLEGLDPQLQDVVSACHLAWMDNPEFSAMEVDIVFGGDGAKVVDAKVTVFG